MAEREFRRAIELNPSAASVRHAYALFLSCMGRFDEALAEVTRAGDLDPLSPVMSVGVGRVLDIARRHEEAVAQYHCALEIDPHFGEGYFDLAMAFRHLGRNDDALAADLKAVSLAPDKAAYRSNLAISYALTGWRDAAQQELDSLMTLAKRNYVSPVDLAFALLALGDVDGALSRLEEAVAERSAEVLYFAVDPDFGALFDHPRFQTLLARIGLPWSPPAAHRP